MLLIFLKNCSEDQLDVALRKTGFLCYFQAQNCLFKPPIECSYTVDEEKLLLTIWLVSSTLPYFQKPGPDEHEPITSKYAYVKQK